MKTILPPPAVSDHSLDNGDLSASKENSGRNILLGIWRFSDPKISLASISSMFLGACAAAAAGPIQWDWLILTVVGIISLEAAKNASGDVFDYDADMAVTNADRSPFSGGKRVIVDGLMTHRQTSITAALFYLAGIVAGMAIVILHEPHIIFFGLVGVGLAYFYNAPPIRLSYHGMGELAVAVVYGPLICCGTYMVQRQTVPVEIVLLSIPLGILISAFLIINEFPDRKADLSVGKKNLVVRLGVVTASRLFVVMVIVAYLVVVALQFSGVVAGAWGGLIGLPFGIMAITRVLQTKETALIIPAQKWTLLAFVLTAVGIGIGLIM